MEKRSFLMRAVSLRSAPAGSHSRVRFASGERRMLSPAGISSVMMLSEYDLSPLLQIRSVAFPTIFPFCKVLTEENHVSPGTPEFLHTLSSSECTPEDPITSLKLFTPTRCQGALILLFIASVSVPRL